MRQQQRSQWLDWDARKPASSEATVTITKGDECSFHDFQIIMYTRSIIYNSEETRSTSQKLPACLHKNNKQDSHIYQYRKYSQLFLSLFDNPLRKEFEKKARLLLFHRNTFTNSIIGKDALNFKTNRTSFLFISFSRLIYRYKYRDIEREQ